MYEGERGGEESNVAEESVTEPIESAPDDVREVILKVLALEKDLLYSDRPRLRDDIRRAIEEIVR